MATTDWRPGKKLKGGIYKIVQEIGRGGFGITYLAQSTGNFVVIKTLERSHRNRPLSRKKFEDEATRLKKISSVHPNIVNFIDSFDEMDIFCIVMEHVEGENLRHLLYKTGTVSEKCAIGYIRQIGEALSVIHKEGLVHRDVKPSNIILCSKTRRCVLVDFGLAREIEVSHSESTVWAFTDGYAPIEQYPEYGERQKRKPRTDVYALAATLYVLLTGTEPTASKIRKEARIDPLKQPKALNPHISDSVNQAILKGLEIQPEHRPQNIEEWLSFLSQAPHQSAQFRTTSKTVRYIRNTLVPECLSRLSMSRYYPTQLIRSITKRERLFFNLVVGTAVIASIFIYVDAPLLPRYIFRPHTVGASRNDNGSNEIIIDYSSLEKYLMNEEYELADRETFEILHSSLDHQDREIKTEKLNEIQCGVVTEIDSLWSYYSNGLFSFSIQKAIWEDLGGELGQYDGLSDESIANDFITQVGWEDKYKTGLRIFQKDEPLQMTEGYFPLKANTYVSRFGVPYFSQKLENCQKDL